MTLHSFLKFWLPKRNRAVILGLALVLLVGILTPTGFVSAGPLGSIGKAILNGMVTLVFAIINAVAVTFLELAQALFSWISSPDFMSVSFTGPDNYIVYTGWTLVRNLANTGILLGLVFIGLATAFNVASYNTKKMLLRLLVAALLINFTPVFCGAIIDGSNILTWGFLKSAPTIQSGWGNIFSQQFTALSNNLLDNVGVNIAKALMILAFNFISAIIFLIFAALFAFRYAVLWLLVILSPLAFLAWALGENPKAKKIFEQWWQNFLNWSIIAIPAAFVIFLTDQLVSHAMNNPIVSDSADVASVSSGFVTPFATYGVPILFLIAGFFFTLSTSAQGSSLIISSAKKIGGKAGKAAGGAVAKGGKALARKASTATAKGAAGFTAGRKEAHDQASNFAQRWTSSIRGGIPGAFKEDTIEKGTKQAEEWATRKGKTPFGYARRAVGRTVLKAGVKSEQTAYEAKQKKAEQFDLQTNASRYQSANKLGKLAIASQAIKKGEFDKLAKKADINAEEAKNLYRSAIHLRDNKTQKGIEGHFVAEMGEELGAIAQKLGTYTPEQKEKDRVEKGYTSYTDKIVAERRDQEAIKQLAPSLGTDKTNSKAVNEAIHRFWGGSQIEKAAETAGPKFTESFRQSAPKMEWYLEVDDNTGRVRNADGAFYRANTVAQRSGVGFTEDVTMKDLKTKFIEKQKVSEEIQRIRRMGENAREKRAEREKSTPKKKTKPRKRKFDYYKKH